jgi:mRNA-degrading endonuclease RelE of RelBE toxin-antitoxin system
MAAYQIEVTEEARADLHYYTASERKVITSEIRSQLGREPLIETRNGKPLRPNPIAPWQLRAGKFRVFYSVDETAQSVVIAAVGHKEHNALLIQGREVKL